MWVGVRLGVIILNNACSPCPVRLSEDMWPVMEAMSQDAIEEMVEDVFKMANADIDQG